MDKEWTYIGLIMDKYWTNTRLFQINWTKPRQTLDMDKDWTNSGQSLDKPWTKIGHCVQSLSDPPFYRSAGRPTSFCMADYDCLGEENDYVT